MTGPVVKGRARQPTRRPPRGPQHPRDDIRTDVRSIDRHDRHILGRILRIRHRPQSRPQRSPHPHRPVRGPNRLRAFGYGNSRRFAHPPPTRISPRRPRSPQHHIHPPTSPLRQRRHGPPQPLPTLRQHLRPSIPPPGPTRQQNPVTPPFTHPAESNLAPASPPPRTQPPHSLHPEPRIQPLRAFRTPDPPRHPERGRLTAPPPYPHHYGAIRARTAATTSTAAPGTHSANTTAACVQHHLRSPESGRPTAPPSCPGCFSSYGAIRARTATTTSAATHGRLTTPMPYRQRSRCRGHGPGVSPRTSSRLLPPDPVTMGATEACGPGVESPTRPSTVSVPGRRTTSMPCRGWFRRCGQSTTSVALDVLVRS
ncbi:hypothetical protein NRB20_12280 [Nocardia sp. RB20]|uniref:Uncharacterized protein n=1 Tax=Nocardia macrotermitis TaxID=2585198 RepID=A0A7K0CXC5_9NOCA|nr:hypothetical protein [Nocardia macrotermitis]